MNHQQNPRSREIPPGTTIFGVVYSDASCGCWMSNHGDVTKQVRQLKACGLSPIGILRLRMRDEALVESVG